MKFTKLFAAAVAVMAVVTACQEPVESVNPNAGMEIAVSAQMYNFTKATDTAFEEGDQIGLHIVIPEGAYLNNAKYTYTEGALVSESVNYWYKDETIEADVLAYYPYSATATYKAEGLTFTVGADQSVEGGYAASDLLVAATASKPTAEVVALPFKHALSKVVINIESELDEAIQSVMFADVYGSAVVDLKEGTSTVNGDKGTIKAAKVADKESYTLIIVPQEQVSPRIFVTIEGDKQYVFNIEAAADFAAGKVATANIALTKELVGTEFSAEITDWVGDSELQFNPSEENTPEEGEPTDPENPEGGEVVEPLVNIIGLDPWQWTSDNAWFAIYFFNASGASWSAMTDDDKDGYWEVEIPEGYVGGDGVIFCRMNPEYTSFGWDVVENDVVVEDHVWNQTVDLKLGEGNFFTVASWGDATTEGKSTGTWSTK